MLIFIAIGALIGLLATIMQIFSYSRKVIKKNMVHKCSLYSFFPPLIVFINVLLHKVSGKIKSD